MGLRQNDHRFAALTRPGGKTLLASQEIRDVRDWLMDTYGGHWGTLQIAADQVEAMERKLEQQAKEIKRLTRMKR